MALLLGGRIASYPGRAYLTNVFPNAKPQIKSLRSWLPERNPKDPGARSSSATMNKNKVLQHSFLEP